MGCQMREQSGVRVFLERQGWSDVSTTAKLVDCRVISLARSCVHSS